jgi:glycerol-3-phosphate dehydrogenase
MEAHILSKIKRKLGIKDLDIHITIDEDNIVYLEGEVNTWQEVIEIGILVGKKRKVKNVVNNLLPKGVEIKKRDRTPLLEEGKEIGVIQEVDVLIIGGGIIGCGIARELSKYDLKICLVEKEEDVAEGTSKANNGMIHPGNSAHPFTQKAKLNVKGNAMYSKWAEELNFPFKRTGSLIISYNKKEKRFLNLLYLVGKLNRVPNMKRISGKEAMKLETNIKEEPILALWTPTTAYVDGYGVTIALAENAADNGVDFMLGTEVVDILIENGKVMGVVTNKGIIKSRYIINSAGVYADDIAEMAGDKFYTIHPRKGGILIFDKDKYGVSRSVGIVKMESKNKQSKGGGPQSTIEGNSLWGPSAMEVMDKEDISFSKEDLEYSLSVGSKVNPNIKKEDIISYFSGLRAADYKEDFIIEKSRKVKGFIHVAGIQSPGLTAAPAIAERVVNFVKEEEKRIKKELKENTNYNSLRKAPIVFRNLSREMQDEIIKKNPSYGNIICRCETITEGEIVDAVHGSIPCTTVDGVKRRTRATMGRCQGSFCGPKIVSILARELNRDVTEITKNGQNSFIIRKKAREINKAGGVKIENNS